MYVIMMILFMCIWLWRVKSMYFILLLSQMSKLQFCSESNSAAIFQLKSLPGKNLFWASDWDFFFWNCEKRRLFWIGNGAYIQPLVIGRKVPVGGRSMTLGEDPWHLGKSYDIEGRPWHWGMIQDIGRRSMTWGKDLWHWGKIHDIGGKNHDIGRRSMTLGDLWHLREYPWHLGKIYDIGGKCMTFGENLWHWGKNHDVGGISMTFGEEPLNWGKIHDIGGRSMTLCKNHDIGGQGKIYNIGGWSMILGDGPWYQGKSPWHWGKFHYIWGRTMTLGEYPLHWGTVHYNGGRSMTFGEETLWYYYYCGPSLQDYCHLLVIQVNLAISKSRGMVKILRVIRSWT